MAEARYPDEPWDDSEWELCCREFDVDPARLASNLESACEHSCPCPLPHRVAALRMYSQPASGSRDSPIRDSGHTPFLPQAAGFTFEQFKLFEEVMTSELREDGTAEAPEPSSHAAAHVDAGAQPQGLAINQEASPAHTQNLRSRSHPWPPSLSLPGLTAHILYI